MQEELLHKYGQNTNLTFYCADCALDHNVITCVVDFYAASEKVIHWPNIEKINFVLP